MRFIILLLFYHLLSQPTKEVTGFQQPSSILKFSPTTEDQFSLQVFQPVQSPETNSTRHGPNILSSAVWGVKNSNLTLRKPSRKLLSWFQQSNSKSGGSETDLIVIIIYSKTGNHVSKQLSGILESQGHISSKTFARGSFRRTHSVSRSGKFECKSFDQFEENRKKPKVVLVNGPDVFCDGWAKGVGPNTKIIHFVREPVAMSLSSYFYHAQHPTPEKWVYDVKPCEHDLATLKYMADKVGLKLAQLKDVVKFCKELYPDKKEAYYNRLTSLNKADGLRLETARFLISDYMHAGSDLLRMAANSKELRNVPNPDHLNIIKTAWFPTTDTEETSNSLDDTLHFMFGKKPWFEDVEKSYLKKLAGITHGHHVTSSKVSAEERENLAKLLEDDLVLGPVLKHIRSVLDTDEKTFGSKWNKHNS